MQRRWAVLVLLVVYCSRCHACCNPQQHGSARSRMGKSKKKAKISAGAADVPLPESIVLRGPPVVPPGCSVCDGFIGGVDVSSSNVPRGQVEVLWKDSDGPAVISLQPALSPAECLAWIEWGEATGFKLEKHKQSNFIAHRDNGRISINSPEVAAAIWERLRPMTPQHVEGRAATGCSANIRLYKYEPGQRFGKHIDQSNYLGEQGATEYTVLVYLNEAMTGGDTVFYKDHNGEYEATRYAPSKGSVLLHAHGNRCLTHEGKEVTSGVKYLLRTDISYG